MDNCAISVATLDKCIEEIKNFRCKLICNDQKSQSYQWLIKKNLFNNNTHNISLCIYTGIVYVSSLIQTQNTSFRPAHIYTPDTPQSHTKIFTFTHRGDKHCIKGLHKIPHNVCTQCSSFEALQSLLKGGNSESYKKSKWPPIYHHYNIHLHLK